MPYPRCYETQLDSDCWVPEAEVLWKEDGERRHQRLKGPDDRFKIIDEAQFYAVEMAKSWIDDELKYRLPREISNA